MKTGDLIPTYFQLFDCDITQYVRAFVRNDANAQIAGSPVNLPLVGSLGLYGVASLVFPATKFVTVQYIVYSDPAYTIISPSEGAGADTFFQDPSPGTTPPTSNIIGQLDAEFPVPPNNGVQDIIVKGSDRILLVRLETGDNNEPFDLTQTTAIAANFYNADGTILTVAGTVVVAQAGKMSIALTAAQTAALLAQTPVPFSIVLTTTGGILAVNMPNQLAVQDIFA